MKEEAQELNASVKVHHKYLSTDTFMTQNLKTCFEKESAPLRFIILPKLNNLTELKEDDFVKPIAINYNWVDDAIFEKIGTNVGYFADFMLYCPQT